MPCCAVFDCHNNSRNPKTGIKFYRFPLNEEYRKKWMDACKFNSYINVNSARICSIHFNISCKKKTVKASLGYTTKYERDLTDDAIPTENLPTSTKMSENRKDIACESQRVESGPDISAPTSPPRTYLSDTEETSNFAFGPNNVELLKARIVELEQENYRLKKENSSYLANTLVLENKKRELLENLKSAVQRNDLNVHLAVSKVLSPLFTPGQIKMILNKTKKPNWSSEDISAAISLRSISPKAYRYLRNKLHYPLPDLSTLRRWASSLSLEEGFLHDVLSLMKTSSKSLSDFERIVCISFDEIHLSNQIGFDPKNEEAVGPCEAAQVMVVRSLFGRWKQPIYYSFDQNMTKDILMTGVSHLHDCGYDVAAITCDMGGANVGVWKQLGIESPDEPFFLHPVTKEKIYAFADVPHLIKLIRNHYIDQGFISGNGKIINKEPLEKLIEICCHNDIKIAYKLTQNHLDVKGTQRQRVRPAVQLFSNSVAKALELCKNKNLIKHSSLDELIELIQLVNDWFDVFNSRMKYGEHEGVNAFGVQLDNQTDVIQKMSNFVRSMRVVGRKTMLPFQKGILLSNNSLISLFSDLQTKYNIQYLRTTKLNQDVIENLFGYIRGMGNTYDHPSALDFRYRLRWYILGKHSEAVFLVNKTNEDDTEAMNLTSLANGKPYTANDDDFTMTGQMLKHLDKANYDDFPALNGDDWNSQPEMIEDISREGLKYVVGSVCHKYRNKYPHLGSKPSESTVSSDWIQLLDRGGLIHPNKNFWDIALRMEECFTKINGNFIKKGRGVIDNVLALMKERNETNLERFPKEVLVSLVRCRTYIRIKEINRKLRDNDSGVRRSLIKKMKKH